MRTTARLTLIALAALAGCASGENAAEPASPVASQLPLGELPPQTLAKGQCGLFLWARTEPAQRVLMALNTPAVVRVRIGGRTVDLPRTSFEGEPAFGHYREQTYAADGVRLTVQVDIEARGALVGGAVAPSGVIAFEAVGGESTVIPVAGLIACQS